jgi:hypothetical protein
MRRALAVAALALAGGGGLAGGGALAAEPSGVEQLARRIDQLEAEVRALREERAPSGAEHAGLRLGRLTVTLSGFLQADTVPYHQASADEVDPSTGAPLNQTRFSIRRAHLRTDLDYGLAAALLELEASTVTDPLVRLFDAELSLRWPSRTAGAPPYLQGSLGLMRIPFGRENQERDFERLFMERSALVRALFPGENDVGVRLQGGWRFLRYQLAAMNGHPIGDAQLALLDPTRSKDLLGRLGIDTRVRRRLAVQAGLSALWGTGFSTGRPATKDSFAWHDTNGDGQVDPTELLGIPGQPPEPSRTFARYALGGDVRASAELPRLGALTLAAELIWATNLARALLPADPVAVGHPLRELGWYVGVTQQLTRWAAIGLRYDRYDPDADAREQAGAQLVPRDRTFSTWALVAAAFYPPWVRLSLEWDHNRNPLGRDASGAPATLGADMLTLRAQAIY